uniref:Uncharacterized protein n=1 Tax=Arundo donax TaxID=35708 RepID=A0A0A9AGA5_ARUDO
MILATAEVKIRALGLESPEDGVFPACSKDSSLLGPCWINCLQD